ncbi:putative membrane protein YgcG [Devosia sp. UYZn731]|uniref:hypothetical protein n=1 Tax=Devosia sp. UYZn731 TaxID=3156345 RepID=UPI00339949ED
MTKTLSLTISLAIAIIGFAVAAAPAQAATRMMSSSPDAFEYRCERHDGAFDIAGTTAICQTPTVPVTCEFVNGDQAVCAWPGIQNQVAVIRVIGTLPGGYMAVGNGSDGGSFNGNGGGGNGGKGGGFQGPNDFKEAPNNDPKPNFNGPKDFQMAP